MEEQEEPVDPRVQIELERLNASSDDINKLENKLEEANSLFRSTLSDSTASLKLLSQRLGSAVQKARPFYEAREMARRTQLDCHKAAVQYQRASVLHQNARETIQLAEERFLPRRADPDPDSDSPPPQQQRQFEFDSAWQEMLNHATMKLLEAEQLKHSSETEHLRRANTFSEAQRKLKRLEKSLERPVARARPYFDQREVVQQELARQKTVIQQLQRAVSSAKARYSSSLRELESISEQIHQQRRLRELEPDLVPVDLDTCELDSVSATSDYQEDFRLSQEQQYWAEMREQIEAMSANMAGGSEEPAPEPAPEPPLAEELNAARLIARRRRTVSEAGGGGLRAAAGRRLSLAVGDGWPRGSETLPLEPDSAAAAADQRQKRPEQLQPGGDRERREGEPLEEVRPGWDGERREGEPLEEVRPGGDRERREGEPLEEVRPGGDRERQQENGSSAVDGAAAEGFSVQN